VSEHNLIKAVYIAIVFHSVPVCYMRVWQARCHVLLVNQNNIQTNISFSHYRIIYRLTFPSHITE